MGAIQDQQLLDNLRVREAAFGFAIIQTDLSGPTIRIMLETPKTGTEPLPG